MAGEVVFAARVCAEAPKVQICPKIFDQDSGKNVTSFLTSNFFFKFAHFVEEGTFVGTDVRTDVRLYGKTD